MALLCILHVLIQSVGLNRALEYSAPLNWPYNIRVVKLIDQVQAIRGNTVCHGNKVAAPFIVLQVKFLHVYLKVLGHFKLYKDLAVIFKCSERYMYYS